MKPFKTLSILFIITLNFTSIISFPESKSKQKNRSLQDKPKFGFIFLHDEQSTYDKNFYDSAKEICEKLGVEPVFKFNVPESEECYNTAKELAKNGCIGIFADSFGHEDYIIRAAKEFTNVQFAQATGTKAHTEKLLNFHNVFASIYEGRYVTGIAAGMKLAEMVSNGEIEKEEALVGYIGAYPYAEVVSGYTAFYLGVKSVCNYAKMIVRYTYSWYDEEEEAIAARNLIDKDKCKMISQHADSQGAPKVCEEKKVPNIFYNIENKELTNSYLVSSKINWNIFFEYFITSVKNGNEMDYDWVGHLSDNAVTVYEASSLAAPNTQDKMNEAIDSLKNGKLKVFDISKFTVDGKKIESYKADVDTDENFEVDTEAISDGYFHESEYRSAPYFDLRIDGITEIFDDEDDDTNNNLIETLIILGSFIPLTVLLIALLRKCC